MQPVDNRIAVIDLGSNTFHLLIVDINYATQSLDEVFRERVYVYLAKGGISKIKEDRFYFGIEVMESFKSKCDQLNVDHIHAVGTSAIRSAQNGKEFIKKVFNKTQISISVIDGLREAELISRGVLSFSKIDTSNWLIMDIGGGSVEFICNSGNKKFTFSEKVGISELRSKLDYADPITNEEYSKCMAFLGVHLKATIGSLSKLTPELLVGASGPFEIIDLLENLFSIRAGKIYSAEHVNEAAHEIVHFSLKQREEMKGMPIQRADLSLESMLLIHFVLESLGSINSVMVSDYALKEGLIAERYF